MAALLIPDLPDEVARDCLARLPPDAFPAARSVCKLWREELHSPAFYRLRRAYGQARPIIAVTQIERSNPTAGCDRAPKTISFCVAFYEPHSRTWSSPSPVPGGRLPLHCRLAGNDRQLVVVGGWDPSTWAATDGVLIYDLMSATWRHGARIPGPRRSFFACAASPDGRTVYVAGGHDDEKNALRSALAYDVANDKWAQLPDMATERDECAGVFRRGAYHVIGGYGTDTQGQFVKNSEAFDPATGRWGPVEEHTLGAFGASPKGVVADNQGRLLRCTEGHVEVLEDDGEEAATWRKVADLPDAGDGKQAVAPCLVWWPGVENKLTLIGSSRHSAYTLQLGVGGEKDGVRWAMEAVPPEEFSGQVQAACCLEI